MIEILTVLGQLICTPYPGDNPSLHHLAVLLQPDQHSLDRRR